MDFYLTPKKNYFRSHLGMRMWSAKGLIPDRKTTICRKCTVKNLPWSCYRSLLWCWLAVIADVRSLSIHYLISNWTTCWFNLNKFEWSEIYNKNELFDKTLGFLNHFFLDKTLTPFWKTFLLLKKVLFLVLKQLFDVKLLSFSVPKITLVWHVWPG